MGTSCRLLGVLLGLGLGMTLGAVLRPTFGDVSPSPGDGSVRASSVLGQNPIKLATLRLVIEPAERLKVNPVANRDAARVPGVGSGPGAPEVAQVPSSGVAVAGNPAKSAAGASTERKGIENSKCFEDLLSLSLGDDVPGAKERLRKAKCQ
jgi:hypothetical protein